MIIRTEGLEEARYQEPERTDRNSFETFLPFKFARGMSKPSTDPPKPSTGKDINTLKDYNDTIGERIIETPESNLDRWKIAAKVRLYKPLRSESNYSIYRLFIQLKIWEVS